MRKLIYRTFLVGATVFTLALLSLVVVGFLAFRQPSFYAQLKAEHPADEAVAAELQQQTDAFEEWAKRSAARSQSGDSAPAQTHLFEVTEKQLNTSLAAGEFNVGDIRSPRIQIMDDQLRLGAEIKLGDSVLVYSADLKPIVTPDETLRLEIHNSYIGSIPFPLQTLLNMASQHANLSSADFQLDLSGPMPVAVVDLSKHTRNAPTIKSLQCESGQLTVEFQAAERVEVGAGYQRVSR